MVGGWKGVGGAGKAEGSDSSSDKALHYEGFGVQDGLFGIGWEPGGVWRKGDTQRLTLLVDTAQRFILAKIMLQHRWQHGNVYLKVCTKTFCRNFSLDFVQYLRKIFLLGVNDFIEIFCVGLEVFKCRYLA